MIKENMGASPVSIDAKFWVSVKDGSPVKTDGTWVNMPIPNVGPMTLRMTVMREG